MNTHTNKKPTVAVVGRPNVGKSTLFNKIAGKRIAIVEDTPGVTRDRIYADSDWNGVEFTLIDTGGIEPNTDDLILRSMREQAKTAIDIADVIIFVVDLRSGVTANDSDVAEMLLKSGKSIVLCVNKVDSVGDTPPEFYEFYELGLGEPYAVSSIHGTGTGDLLDKVVELLKFTATSENHSNGNENENKNDIIKVAVIGKPNVGKSSIINKFLGEERVIVTDIPGTTRDSIDQYFENEHGRYIFIDTAGIRRQNKISDNIEKYSVLRSKSAVERADVCLIMIDAEEGVTFHDERIAGLSHEAGKASIIVVNKWDLIEKDNSTTKKFTDDIKTAFAYMKYVPEIFVSAKTGQRVTKIFELINSVYAESSKRITTGALNDVLSDAIAKTQPPSDKGRRLKIYYMTQTGTKPPVFVLFVNDAELFHFSYQRYIENQLRETFGFGGTPIRFIIKNRSHEDI
ncbi:MAG: ribosome biogenesis GTPase Der [Oscillospiraceae bacterium]|nr:ribosome biogenesis GTPase Der [Oscillospiraceae bacterium]